MKETLKFERDNFLIGLDPEVVYLQKPYWCNISDRQLKLSIMRPRDYYTYDNKATLPLIIWLCGGGFTKMDRMVHLPEMVYFAKRGFAVASLDYSIFSFTEFPEMLEEVKTGIRFLRGNAEKFGIRKDKIVIMGESAGGYLAGMAAITNGDRTYDAGDYPEESSDVQLAVLYYPPSDPRSGESSPKVKANRESFPDMVPLISKDTVPMYMIHGTVDDQVDTSSSVRLYDRLMECGVTQSRLTIIEGANHGDALCFRDEIKERIENFIRENLSL